jgi:tyrosyl-tRNA synthetase
MFQERVKNKKPIYLHEFLYPLAQAYDSLAMDVDLEIGGSDQIFNMLAGRDLMRIMKNKGKFVLATKLLTDPSGKKMGKTEGNIVAINSPAKEIYGKIMSWPDTMIILGFELCTDLSMKEINQISEKIKKREINPRDAKAMLAREIVAVCHDKKSAAKAEAEFNRVFREKKAPGHMPEIKIQEKEIPLLSLVLKTGLVSSKSEAKRLILQNGVKINGQTQKNWQESIKIKKGLVLRVGKRKFAKIG